MKLPRLRPVVWIALLAAGCSAGDREPIVVLPFDGSAVETAHGLACEASAQGVAFVAGLAGQAVRFDGSGACVDVAGAGELDYGGALTVELLVKPDDWTNPYQGGRGMETLLALSDYFTLGIDRGTGWRLQARLTTTAAKDSVRLSGGEIDPGAWHHVALDHDGESGRTRLWLDGAVVAEQSIPGPLHVQNPKLALRIGTWHERNQAFCGEIDDVRIWRRVLADAELAARAPRP